MRSLEVRLSALEGGRDPRMCLECELRRLNRSLGDSEAGGACRHSPKPMHQHITELDTVEATHVC